MDWVLADVPCTGTGTLRRNPDLKWRFSLAFLQDCINKQQEIFEKAVFFARPGGSIVYITCSLLAEENEQQVQKFEKMFPVELAAPPFQSLPEKGGMDGFFSAVFFKKRL